jgi:hypothetical protein
MPDAKEGKPAALVRKLADHGLGGWVEDKGNKLIDRVIGWAISAAAGAAMSARDWLAQNWWAAARATFMFGIGTYIAVRLARAAYGIWRTNMALLSAIGTKDEAEQKLGTTAATLAAAVISLEKAAAGLARLATPPEKATSANEHTVASVSRDEPTVSSPTRKAPVRGIGIIGDISVVLINRAPLEFQCECRVMLLGFTQDVTASPSELRLMVPGTVLELATLRRASEPAKQSGDTVYRGFANGEAIERRFSETMGRPFSSGSNLAQIPTPTFCEVEIRLPNGHPLDEHKRSGVFLDFELTGRQAVRLVPIPRPQV